MVASVLGQLSPVVAVDIQEYARALASALLSPSELAPRVMAGLAAPIDADDLGRDLIAAWSPLIETERQAIESGAKGDPEPLALFLEAMPLVKFQEDGGQDLPGHIRRALAAVHEELARLDLAESVDSVVSRYFGGLYFGIEQGIQLDVLARRASLVGRAEADTVMSAVLSTASACVGTIGKQFAQPLRPRDKCGAPKLGLWKRIDRDRSLDLRATFEQSLTLLSHRPAAQLDSLAVRSDYREFLDAWEGNLAVVYADPPYTRDHYSRYYHVLETIALRDQPMLSRTNLNGRGSVSRGVYREDRHQSPFSIRTQAPGAFRELMHLTKRRGASLLLSYSPHMGGGRSRPRVVDATDLETLAKQYFRSVERLDVTGVAHSKLTRTDMHLSAPETAEFLLVCQP